MSVPGCSVYILSPRSRQLTFLALSVRRSLAINPKDTNTFASACLDHTVKVWFLGTATANFSLEAHDKGVNYVEYYHGGDKPYMITTGDDR